MKTEVKQPQKEKWKKISIMELKVSKSNDMVEVELHSLCRTTDVVNGFFFSLVKSNVMESYYDVKVI